MNTERFSFLSTDGSTSVAAYKVIPDQPHAMVQISHGMCEYFLRYEGFAHYLAQHGFLVFGHDHQGHGYTATDAEALGFTRKGGGADCLVEDAYTLSCVMKREYPNLPLILFGHSMGSMVISEMATREEGWIYDRYILCGSPAPNPMVKGGIALAKAYCAIGMDTGQLVLNALYNIRDTL